VAKQSDFNWQSLVLGGITSGIKSGLEGIGSSATEWAICWVLNAAFGYQTPKEKEKAQLKTALTNIQDEIGAINAALQTIEAQLQSLQQEVTTDFVKQLNQTLEDAVNSQISQINTQWSALATNLATSLGQTIPVAASATTGSGDWTVQFAQNVITAWNIPACVQTISDDMLAPYESNNIGLLDSWTDTLVLGINSGEATTRQAYGFLEQNFLGVLQWLYRGYTLCVSAEMRNALTAAQAKGGQTPEQISQTVQLAGTNWIAANATPNLRNLTQLFVQCAHRIVLSQYMRPIKTSVATGSGSNTFAPFTSQADAQFCLARANLVAWLINQKYGAASNPGIIVDAYLRPSLVSGSGGPPLTPNASYSASGGSLLQLSGEYKNNWFKVVDFADAAYSQITDFATSAIPICTYVWQTPAPVAGVPVAASGQFAAITPTYYDTLTLDTQTTASETTVIYGYSIDMSAITTNFVYVVTPWTGNQGTPGNVKDAQYLIITHSIDAQQKTLNGSISATGNYKGPDASVSATLTRNLSYVGTHSASLSFAIVASIDLSGQNSTEGGGDASVPWVASAGISIGGAAYLSASLTHPGNGFGGSGKTNSDKESVNTLETISLAGTGQNLSVQLSYVLTEQHQSAALGFGGSGGQGYVSANVTLSQLVAAWPQPVVSG
jgi:hypothetical protein